MLEQHNEILAALLKDAARSLTACRAGMPYTDGMQSLVTDAEAAQARGYFTPGEDERLRTAYVHYLGVRAALWETVQSLLPYIELPRKFKKGDWQAHLRAFAVAFSSAAMLLRSGYYLIDMAADRPVVRDKLDEAEPRYGIERKQFTEIYDSLISTRRMAKYYSALSFYQRYESEIYSALTGEFAPVADILRFEEPYFETRFRGHVKRKAKFNIFSLRRRRLSAVSKIMFFLFKSIGSDIAELKQPLVKPRGAGKRVTNGVRTELLKLVQPGDVFVTRHDDAMSNLFLPGFWPHAALYIGTDAERARMGVAACKPEHQSIPGEVRFLESKKDGVLFRPAKDTLQIDACVILRPKISPQDLRAALNRALSHSGKLYDFVFDFASADRLACTELIYRTYNGFAGSAGAGNGGADIDFKLAERAARQCLSAEDLLNQAVGNGWFEVVALYGVGDDKLSSGEEAYKRLIKSYDYRAE
ncbi:MAG: hypothetical protein L3J65_00205 [Robiginitomaculum sp.]|nr:hypothetical protein [Robiginitomaculum sp.]